MHNKLLFVLALSLVVAACSPISIAPLPDATPTPTPADLPTLTPEPTGSPTPVFTSNPFNDGMVARRNGNYPRAIAAFMAVLGASPSPTPNPTPSPAQDLLQEAQYRLGEAYWLNNDDAKAIVALTAYLKATPDGAHAPEAHYILADAYRATKAYPNSIEQLKIYRNQSQTLVGDIDATIADILVLAGDPTGAITQYDQALKDASLPNTTRVSILMRAADVHAALGQPALAGGRYDAALAIVGDARSKADLLLRAGEAYATANKLDLAVARWTEAIVKYPEQRGAYQSLVDLLNRGGSVDEYQRGLVDYYANSFDAAIAAFERHLKTDSPRTGDARYYIASSNSGKGAYSQAIAGFDTIIKQMPKDKRVPDAYFGKAAAYAAIGKIDDAVAAYRKFASAFPENDRADDALWSGALLLDRAKRYSDAAGLFESLQAKYPARDHAAEALFRAGFDYYRGNDFKTASLRWQTVTKNYSQSTMYPRSLFWLGKAAQARGLNADAKNYWTQSAGGASGYYAWRAKEMLNPTKPSGVSYDLARYAMGADADRVEFENWLAGWSKGDSRVSTTIDNGTRSDLRYRRGVELLRLDRTVEARREFAAIIEIKKQDPRALYALALYLQDNNLFSLSLDCAERIAKLANDADAPPAPRYLWQLRYPTHYADLVVAEAKSNQIDPLLYFGLIRQESSFNPWSTSSADARGLAQVIPSTARDIAGRLNVKNFTLDQLYLPYLSVRFGVWYFAQDLTVFNEPLYALAAYNAGSGRVKQWQRSDLDLAVEEIELRETSLYVRLVYSNWRQYQALYK